MPKPTYAEKLKDPRWQKRRLELLQAAKWQCQGSCQNQSSTPTLHVHHRLYLRATDPWDYEDWAYEVLCDECHKKAQTKMEEVAIALAKHRDLAEMCHAFSLLGENAGTLCSEIFDLCACRKELVPSLISDLKRLNASRFEVFNAGYQSRPAENNHATTLS